MAQETRTDRYLESLRNRKLVALLIVCALAIIGVSNVLESLGKIGGVFGFGAKPLELTAVRVHELTNGPTAIDILVRNTSNADVIIQKVHLELLGPTKLEQEHRPFIGPIMGPSAFYDLLLGPRQRRASIVISQRIPAGQADRLVVILALGETDGSDIAHSAVADPAREVIYSKISGHAQLELAYNKSGKARSEPFMISLHDIGNTQRVASELGPGLRPRYKLLRSESLGEVEDAVRLFGELDDIGSLPYLRELRTSNTQYLKDSQAEFYKKVTSGGYGEIEVVAEDPNEAYSEFIALLDSTIVRLESQTKSPALDKP